MGVGCRKQPLEGREAMIRNMKEPANVKRFFALFFALSAAVFIFGCVAGSTQRIDLDSEIVDDSGSTKVQDYRTVGEKMARSLIQQAFIQNADSPPTIAFLKVQNRTSEYIDTEAFLEKIRTILLKNCGGKIIFLDRSATKAIQKERGMKERGKITSSEKSSQHVLGADYFLTGSIHSINRIEGSKKTQYRRYSFRITDADTTAILWEDDYESRVLVTKDYRDR